MSQAVDTLDQVLGPELAARLQPLRDARPAVRAGLQASWQALYEPAQPAGLSRRERALAGLRVALQLDQPRLLDWHHRRAQAAGATPAELDSFGFVETAPHTRPRYKRIIAHIDRLTLRPAEARAEHLQALQAAGLDVASVVTLSQLVAFENFFARVVVGLDALARPAGPQASSAEPAPRVLPAAAAPSLPFTLDELDWASWLPTVDANLASDEQLAVLDEAHAGARNSAYYLTLLHDAEALRQRSRLYNAIMYGNVAGSLPRAEREFSTVVVSRLNGCPYCASVHARFFAQLTKQPALVQALLDEGVQAAALPPRLRALADLAAALSVATPRPEALPLAALRAQGLDDAQLLDAINAAALFGWANRLMQTLGEPRRPRTATD